MLVNDKACTHTSEGKQKFEHLTLVVHANLTSSTSSRSLISSLNISLSLSLWRGGGRGGPSSTTPLHRPPMPKPQTLPPPALEGGRPSLEELALMRGKWRTVWSRGDKVVVPRWSRPTRSGPTGDKAVVSASASILLSSFPVWLLHALLNFVADPFSLCCHIYPRVLRHFFICCSFVFIVASMVEKYCHYYILILQHCNITKLLLRNCK